MRRFEPLLIVHEGELHFHEKLVRWLELFLVEE